MAPYLSRSMIASVPKRYVGFNLKGNLVKQFLATIVLLAALLGAIQAPTPAIASETRECSYHHHNSNTSRTMYLGLTLYIDFRNDQCHHLSHLWHDYPV